jgi:hypothetical protein
MHFSEFEERAWELWEQIPDAYKSGVDGLLVQRKSVRHPELDDIYTLGECITETYPSDFGGPDTLRSYVALYHGSFDALAVEDEEFDWEHELWETLTHELKHHLESLAKERSLEEVDYAADENFKRLEGGSFDPHFYRGGERVDVGLYRVEDEWFLELPASDDDGAARFAFQGADYALTLPSERGDVCYIEIVDGVVLERGALTVVIARPMGWVERLARAMRSARLIVTEYEASVERLA